MFAYTQAALANIQAFVSFVADVNVFQEVDVYNLPGSSSEDPYVQAVNEARLLLRKLEAVAQSLFDDGIVLMTFAQAIPTKWTCTGAETDTIDRQPLFAELYGSAKLLKSGASLAVDSLGELLSVSAKQSAQENRFRESLALRISRMSILDENRRLSNFLKTVADPIEGDEDVVDMDFIFRNGVSRPIINGPDNTMPATNFQADDFDQQQPTSDDVVAVGSDQERSPGMSKEMLLELVDDELPRSVPEKGEDTYSPRRFSFLNQIRSYQSDED